MAIVNGSSPGVEPTRCPVRRSRTVAVRLAAGADDEGTADLSAGTLGLAGVAGHKSDEVGA
jgi:nicotinamide mononucleotide (NMN) deamidase PncC